jgi:formamidopyrimidine-DNA glycosylase
MPELPEAEIARRQLDRWLGTGPLTAVRLEDPAVVRTHASSRPAHAVPDARAVLDGLIGVPIHGTARHGKRIGWRIGTRGVVVHLGMSGKLVRGDEPPRFARVGFTTAERTVWLCDQRRFGCVVVGGAAELDARLRDGHGPDALDEAPDADGLRGCLRGRRAVKVALLDQAVLAGVGNIHAVEALFQAGIHPATPCSALTADQLARLAAVLPVHLARVVAAEEEGEIVYMTEGRADNPFDVYGRADLPCRACGTPVAVASLGGRSTFWCPDCQPAEVR